MEEDAYQGERDDSQSVTFSTSPSLSWWMMESLWHARLSVPDTFLLQDGHLVEWYFTSAASGKVLKHATKRLTWEDLSIFFSRAPMATSVGNRKNSWRPEIIATAQRLKSGRTYPVMLTAADLKSLREKHNAHLLEEMVAIQSYVAKRSFVGCGVFETEFERKEGRRRASQAALATFELAQWPRENLTWFQDIEPRRDSSHPEKSRSCLGQYAETGISKRVHGVIHRMLATTTKAVVAHVEKKTGRIILRVVAQYAFRPGSGQPTLLWLDSVTCQHREQLPQRSAQEGDGGGTSRSHSPADLTHGLRQEIERPWSTFFPPKLSDLASGGSAASFLAGRPVSRCRQDDSSQIIGRSLYGESSRPASKALHASAPTLLATETPLLQTETRPLELGLIPDSEAPWEAADDHQKSDGWAGGVTVDHAFGRAGGQCQHFSLPTESWAYRSSGERGLYFSGRGERLPTERWPRRRSTGTTMRIDGRRPDLRTASETQRPWTVPFQVGHRTEDGAAGTGFAGASGAINRPIASRASGCFGDYCHHNNDIPHPSAGQRKILASKIVSYRSILDCRAEEKAMSSLSLRREISRRHGDPIISGGFVPSLKGGEARSLRTRASLFISTGKTTGVAPSSVAEHMRALAIKLNDLGRVEFYSLCSSHRKRAGDPEAARRAMDELLYEKAMRHLHTTSIYRPVPVCDICAAVYGYMDGFRRRTKQLEAVADQNTRVARVALRRQLERQKHRTKADLNLV